MVNGQWLLTAEMAERPLFIGSDIGEPITQALHDHGVATTRDPVGARIAMTARSREIPATTQWVHCPYMGVNSLVRWLPAEVRVLTRTVDGMPGRMGSYAATAVMAERWQLHRFDLQQDQARWLQFADLHLDTNRPAIIAGTGLVGQACAEALRPHHSSIIGVSHSGRAVEGFDRTYPLDPAPTPIPWSSADVIVITLPLTQHTRGIFSDSILSALVNAHLIIIGRGATLNFDALERAVATGAVRHATIDVLPREPLITESWLWHDPHITLTPHISGLTRPMDAVTSFLRARRHLMAGTTPDGLVEPDRGY